MQIEITFKDEVEAETMEEAYGTFLEYLSDCVNNGDVAAFQFKQQIKTQTTNLNSE